MRAGVVGPCGHGAAEGRGLASGEGNRSRRSRCASRRCGVGAGVTGNGAVRPRQEAGLRGAAEGVLQPPLRNTLPIRGSTTTRTLQCAVVTSESKASPPPPAPQHCGRVGGPPPAQKEARAKTYKANTNRADRRCTRASSALRESGVQAQMARKPISVAPRQTASAFPCMLHEDSMLLSSSRSSRRKWRTTKC